MTSGREDDMDMRMVVRSSTDEDGEPNDRPWLSIKDDNPPEPPAKPRR